MDLVAGIERRAKQEISNRRQTFSLIGCGVLIHGASLEILGR